MTIREIRLAHVRSYELFSAELSDETTLIIGQNGTGKTTLLEAIAYLTTGTSFRGRDRDMIGHDTTRADLALELSSGKKRTATLQLTADDKVKKSFKLDGKITARLPTKARIPTVLFEPDELRLLSSSPERRRRFFDGLLSRLYPSYATILARYQRTLLQRNELLKQREFIEQSAWENQLFVWDIKFAELARDITRARREFVVTSNTRLSNIYSRIANAEHHIRSHYNSSINTDTYQQSLLNHLSKERLADSYRGYTSAGPHRDDIAIYLDSHPAGETASRGEMRTIMLAYKLFEVELQAELHNQAPLILLDDVFSELDASREAALITALAGSQTIITATDLRDEQKIDAKIISL